MHDRVGLRIVIGTALSMFLLSLPANCQHSPGGGAAGGTGGASTGGATRPNNPPTTGNNSYGTIGDLGSRGIYLSGKVQMEDGAPPPEQVLIERVCGGERKAEAYTDLKGRFSFQLGQEQGITADASFEGATGGAGTANMSPGASPGKTNAAGASQAAQLSGNNRIGSNRSLIGCELNASLPGFRSDTVNLGGRRTLDNPEVGTLILHRLANVEGTTISVTTLEAPKEARKAYDKARDALRKDKAAEAQKELAKAVDAYPKFAAAWYQLGVLQAKNNELADARKSYAQAIEADPKLVTPYLPLALLAVRDRNWQEVADTTERLLKLDAVDFPEAYYYNAAANYNLKKVDNAEASARQSLKLDTAHRFPQAAHLLGLILYQKNDYAGAAEQLRNYQQLAPGAPDADEVKRQLAELDRLAGETKAKADKPQQQ